MSELLFVHKYKISHIKRRKKFKNMEKQGKIVLIEKTNDGFLYRKVNNEE